MEKGISTRVVKHEDFEWLFDLHTVTMREYVEPVFGWDSSTAERVFYYDFRPGEMSIITLNGIDVGMFEVDQARNGCYLRRIEIHPDFQRGGIGTAVVKQIISDASHGGQPVWLTVLKNNPAKKLYERLGFKVIEELGNVFKLIHAGFDE